MPTLLITRPRTQAESWTLRLRARGVEAIPLPLIETWAVNSEVLLKPVEAAWRKLSEYDTVMFVSPSAVASFMHLRPSGMKWPPAVRAATPGPGTNKALRGHGVATVLSPSASSPQFDSDALWATIGEMPWGGRRVLIVHGGAGRDHLAGLWQEAGATVERVQSYERRAASWTEAQRAIAGQVNLRPKEFVWVLSSGAAVDALDVLMPGVPWAEHRAVATHPAIAVRAADLGFTNVTVVRPDIEAIVAAAA